MKTISILVPAYNEEVVLGMLHERLEFFCANNGRRGNAFTILSTFYTGLSTTVMLALSTFYRHVRR